MVARRQSSSKASGRSETAIWTGRLNTQPRPSQDRPGTPIASAISRPSPSRRSQSRAAYLSAGLRTKCSKPSGARMATVWASAATSMSGTGANQARPVPASTGANPTQRPVLAPDRQPQPACRNQDQSRKRHGGRQRHRAWQVRYPAPHRHHQRDPLPQKIQREPVQPQRHEGNGKRGGRHHPKSHHGMAIRLPNTA
jgi:hypothetical protein